MARQPNEQLFNAYVSEEFRKTAEQAQKNVELKINEYIAQFRTNLDDIVKEVEQKDYTSAFVAEADAVLQQAQTAKAEIDKINAIVADIEKGTPQLQEKLTELKTANSELDKKLTMIQAKAENFGTNVGKFVGATVKRVVTGGLSSL